MPHVTDRTAIRTILEANRSRAAQALADLEPGFFEHATWFCAEGKAPALALVYRAFTTPALITVGDANELRVIPHEIDTTLHLAELYTASSFVTERGRTV